jgi:hypothetical protein
MGARELVNFVNTLATAGACLVAKIKNGRTDGTEINLQNKTYYPRPFIVHVVHMFTAVEVAEMTESYVQNDDFGIFEPRKREYFELSLTYMRLRRYFAKEEKKGRQTTTAIA